MRESSGTPPGTWALMACQNVLGQGLSQLLWSQPAGGCLLVFVGSHLSDLYLGSVPRGCARAAITWVFALDGDVCPAGIPPTAVTTYKQENEGADCLPWSLARATGGFVESLGTHAFFCPQFD